MAARESIRLSLEQRRARGEQVRHEVPLSSQPGWRPAADRANPVALLEAQELRFAHAVSDRFDSRVCGDDSRRLGRHHPVRQAGSLRQPDAGRPPSPTCSPPWPPPPRATRSGWPPAPTSRPRRPTAPISFAMKNGVAVYGGFDGTETMRSERDPVVNVTILSGDIGTPSVSNDNSLPRRHGRRGRDALGHPRRVHRHERPGRRQPGEQPGPRRGPLGQRRQPQARRRDLHRELRGVPRRRGPRRERLAAAALLQPRSATRWPSARAAPASRRAPAPSTWRAASCAPTPSPARPRAAAASRPRATRR